MLTLRDRIEGWYVMKYFFYEVLFTCDEVRFLVNIYFFTSLLLLYFGKVKKYFSKRS